LSRPIGFEPMRKDLIATFDPRNIEVAKLIRAQYIDEALRKAQ
jgi:hypothetical protein